MSDEYDLSAEQYAALQDAFASGTMTQEEVSATARRLVQEKFAASRPAPPETESVALLPSGIGEADVPLARKILARRGLDRFAQNEILLRRGGIEGMADEIIRERETMRAADLEIAKKAYEASPEGRRAKAQQLAKDQAALREIGIEARLLLEAEGTLPPGVADDLSDVELGIAAGLLPDPNYVDDSYEANAAYLAKLDAEKGS